MDANSVAQLTIGSAALRKVMVDLRRVWRDAFGSTPFVRFFDDEELAGAGCGETADQVSHMGARAVPADSLAELPAKLKLALAENSLPKVALVRKVGAFLLAANPVQLDSAEASVAAAAGITRLAAGRGGVRTPSPGVDLTDAARAPLAGSVALVTGAASGLGCGIAQGLVEAGAAVAFCDIDDQGTETAATGSASPRRTLGVHMDVTSEESVAAAFDRVLRHWGHVDIVVCAAGIAPPYELVDLPLDKWRLALEVNLTGYFLAAREAARIMRAQGEGGCMVVISSKTGLDASKSNSAYNATKAGELHLMRGWALELGADGIRVNAVAPGNVFEGSKIWNPEYIKTAARKKGIQPEEVIPYYTSLTALKREIKRSDVAAAVVFLCSDAARCITGQTLVVDSGQVMVR